MSLLVGDIGGTHSRFGIADWEDGRVAVRHERRYLNAEFDDLAEVVSSFHADIPPETPLDLACLAIAAPIAPTRGDQQGTLTNLPWRYSGAAIRHILGGTRTVFINDFAAVGWALPLLEASDLTVLQNGEPDPTAPRAALGAGSGLGTVIALPTDTHWQVIGSEGGHVDLAASNPNEASLLEALWDQFGHASWERVVSGPGLELIYRWKAGEGAPRIGAPDISRAAFDRSDATAEFALEQFCAFYGAQAGNLALTTLPRGGLYLAGGISPEVLSGRFLTAFLARFLDKGRMRPLLENIPLYLITSDRSGMLGAAHYARVTANL